MLYLVGVTRGFTPEVAHQRAKAKEVVSLVKGVYCDPEDKVNLPEFLKENALRIGNYLYGNAVLVQASANQKGAVESSHSTLISPKYKLFLASTYCRSIKIECLEIVQSDALKNKEIRRFCAPMEDRKEGELGPFSILCASDELVFLQNFSRRRDQLERFLPESTLLDLRERLEHNFGNELLARLADVVRQTGEYGAEFERAAHFLKTPMDSLRRQNAPANLMEFTLGWHGRPVANLIYNGVTWAFNYVKGWDLPLQAQGLPPNQIPAFINNLLPEGPMRDLLRSKHQGTWTTLLESSERFMSNVAIVSDPRRLDKIPLDVLDGRLHDFTDLCGVFKGTVVGIPLSTGKTMADMGEIMASEDMLRVAGMQAKMLMNLSFDGDLSPAIAQPATHILKFPGVEQDGSAIKGAVEWASMTLAKGSGMPCADFAMVRIKGSTSDALAYITERFDIPQNADDYRMIFAEDLCAVLGFPPEAKGMPDLNEIVDAIKKISTDVQADMENLFRQIAVNYLLENADFHAKNASILKVAHPRLKEFRSIRLAPAYDILRTRRFAAMPLHDNQRESMQLGFHVNGDFYDRDWKEADFKNIGALCGLSPESSVSILRSCAEGISTTAIDMAQKLPAVLKEREFRIECEHVLEVFERAVEHCHEFFPDLPNELVQAQSKRTRAKAGPLRRP